MNNNKELWEKIITKYRFPPVEMLVADLNDLDYWEAINEFNLRPGDKASTYFKLVEEERETR